MICGEPVKERRLKFAKSDNREQMVRGGVEAATSLRLRRPCKLRRRRRNESAASVPLKDVQLKSDDDGAVAGGVNLRAPPPESRGTALA